MRAPSSPSGPHRARKRMALVRRARGAGLDAWHAAALTSSRRRAKSIMSPPERLTGDLLPTRAADASTSPPARYQEAAARRRAGARRRCAGSAACHRRRRHRTRPRRSPRPVPPPGRRRRPGRRPSPRRLPNPRRGAGCRQPTPVRRCPHRPSRRGGRRGGAGDRPAPAAAARRADRGQPDRQRSPQGPRTEHPPGAATGDPPAALGDTAKSPRSAVSAATRQVGAARGPPQ
jgi:hypothetical protein